MLKKYKDKSKPSWVHVKCIQWHMKKISSLEVKSGFITFLCKESIPLYELEECLKCNKLVKGDYLIGCEAQGCQKTFHSGCIDAHLIRENETGLDERVGGKTFNCEEHSKIVNKKLNDPFGKTYGKDINTDTLTANQPK